MIKELRMLDKENRPKSNYIRCLQNKGKIKQIINEKGYVCYDEDELEKYYSNVKMGRPPKLQKNCKKTTKSVGFNKESYFEKIKGEKLC